MLAAVVLVVSTALRVAGPALIAYGIDTALPAVVEQTTGCRRSCVVVVYLVDRASAAPALIGWYVVVAARLTQAVMLDLRKRIFLHTQRLSLEFHESYTSGRIISRQTSDLDSIRELLDGGLNELVSGVLFGGFTLIALLLLDWQSGVILLVMGIPLSLLMRWFYLRSQVVYRESRVVSAKVIVQVRRDDDRHPRRQGVPQGAAQRRGVRRARQRLPRRQHALDPAVRHVRAGADGGRRRSRSRSSLLWGGIRVADGAHRSSARCWPPCCTCATSSRRCRRSRSS